MTEIKPCRWCKSTDLHIEEFYVGCLSCGAIGPSAESKEAAIKAWNTRANGWISVENRLPEEYELVLVTNGLNHYWLDRIIPDRGWSGSDEEWDDPGDAPTHWMPLPDPPEDE